LVNDFQRISYATGPEGIPNAVNLVAKFPGYHIFKTSMNYLS
jgi:hypothetical protein